jgi:hypothetical protein
MVMRTRGREEEQAAFAMFTPIEALVPHETLNGGLDIYKTRSYSSVKFSVLCTMIMVSVIEHVPMKFA